MWSYPHIFVWPGMKTNQGQQFQHYLLGTQGQHLHQLWISVPPPAAWHPSAVPPVRSAVRYITGFSNYVAGALLRIFSCPGPKLSHNYPLTCHRRVGIRSGLCNPNLFPKTSPHCYRNGLQKGSLFWLCPRLHRAMAEMARLLRWV